MKNFIHKRQTPLLLQARQLVANYALPASVLDFGEENEGDYAVEEARGWYFDGHYSRTFKQLNNDVLATSLDYFIDLDTSKANSEEDIPLGVSKYKGLPHLPDSIEWPANSLFMAQINLETLHQHDPWKPLPASGLLYLFMDLDQQDRCHVFHYDGPVSALKRRPYPPLTTRLAKYYLEDHQEAFALLKLTPRFKFYIDDIEPALPPALVKELETLLGMPMAAYNGSFNMFGQPRYWQGEGEYYDDDENEEQDLDETPDILLYQDEFGEGTIHCWITPENLVKRDFSHCYMTYSGT